MKLHYKAIDKSGKKLEGIIEAKDPKEAGIFLRKKELTPIKITAQTKSPFNKVFDFMQGSKSSDLVFFTRQLSLMMSAGLTLMQSLMILRDQIQNSYMTEVIQSIITDIQGGSNFSTAISKYPELFSPIYISLIKSAETSGLFDKILLKLADNLEKHEKLVKTIRGALLYPLIVLLMMVGVLVIMLVFVIPPLAKLYEDLKVEMPLPTQIVLAFSSFTIRFWPVIIILGIVLLYLFRRWHKTPEGKRIVDGLTLKVPVFGLLIKEKILAEFSRTAGLLIGTGVLVVEALTQASDTTGNVLYHEGVMGVAKMVEKGVSMGDALATNEIFPPLVVQMAKVGEQTGKLDDSMLRVSQYYESEVDQMVQNLTTIMEPFIIVLLGVGVGFLIISIITPLYGLISSIK